MTAATRAQPSSSAAGRNRSNFADEHAPRVIDRKANRGKPRMCRWIRLPLSLCLLLFSIGITPSNAQVAPAQNPNSNAPALREAKIDANAFSWEARPDWIEPDLTAQA